MTIFKNKVIIVGNLVSKPEVILSKKDKEFANLILVTKSFKKDEEGGLVEYPQFHRVSIFKEGLVRLAKHNLDKGDSIYVEGSLSTSKWQDKEGKNHYRTNIVVSSFEHDLQFNPKSYPKEDSQEMTGDEALERFEEELDEEEAILKSQIAAIDAMEKEADMELSSNKTKEAIS